MLGACEKGILDCVYNRHDRSESAPAMTTQNTERGPSVPALTHDLPFLPSGIGAWDVTSYPFGGDFVRPSVNIPLRNVRPSAKEGWMLAECEYPNRKGVRTLCLQVVQSAYQVEVSK